MASINALPDTYLPMRVYKKLSLGPRSFEDFLFDHTTPSTQAVGDNCGICLTPLDPADPECEPYGSNPPEDSVLLSNDICAHVFHNGCVGKVFETSNTCPMCRAELFDDEDTILMLAQQVEFLSSGGRGIRYDEFFVIMPDMLAICLRFAAAYLLLDSERPVGERGWIPTGVEAHPSGPKIVDGMILAMGKMTGKRTSVDSLEEVLLHRAVTALKEVDGMPENTTELSEFAERVINLGLRNYGYVQRIYGLGSLFV